MNEQYIAIAILSVAYIFLSPVVFLMLIGGGSPDNFKEEYKGAFLAWHGLILIVIAFSSVVSAIFWALGKII